MAGEIVHVEYPCQEIERGQKFWNGLFGWEFGESMPGMEYRMARTSESSGAAIYTSDDRGHPNYYYDTPDIEAASAKVRELGGEAGDKTPVPTHGWFSHCTDSEGNAFSLWQADTNAG